MPPSMRPLTVAAALSAAWLLALPAAQAQTGTQHQTQPAPNAQPSASSISDQKLDAAAAAIENVVTVKESYQHRMASATPSEKQKLAGEASDAMKKAVTDQGLSVDEYDQILEVARNDPSVRDRLLQRIHPPGK